MSEYGEPWRCSEVGRDDAVFDQYGELIADNLQTGVARRIKCCVNACDGISTSVLELQGVPSFELCKRLEHQRDELLAALNAWRSASAYSAAYSHLGAEAQENIAEVWQKAECLRDAAIAKVKP